MNQVRLGTVGNGPTQARLFMGIVWDLPLPFDFSADFVMRRGRVIAFVGTDTVVGLSNYIRLTFL